MSENRYVILDRDGVINHDSDEFIKTPEEWLPLPGSLEAISLLNQHHYQVVVISNQSGIARGLFDHDILERIHCKMHDLTQDCGGHIAAVYFCPHGPHDHCYCRKPNSGLFERFAQDFQVNLHGLYAVGDSLRDLQAAVSVGAAPILVKTGKGQQTLVNHPDITYPVFENLYAAVEHILSRS